MLISVKLTIGVTGVAYSGSGALVVFERTVAARERRKRVVKSLKRGEDMMVYEKVKLKNILIFEEREGYLKQETYQFNTSLIFFKSRKKQFQDILIQFSD